MIDINLSSQLDDQSGIYYKFVLTSQGRRTGPLYILVIIGFSICSISPWGAGGVNNLSFEDLSANLGRTMYQFKFQIPGYYTLLVRSLSVLEGIALASDPNYKVLGAAYPWVARRLLTNTPEELQPTLLSLLYKDGKFNFKRMESLLTQATSPPGRPQRPRDSPAGSEPPRGDALALVLSPQGEFVRGIIVDELAKGADAAWRLAADAAVHDAAGGLSGMANPNDLARTFPLLYTLLDVLEAVPKLADEGDAEQVEGMRRLAAALRESTSAKAEQQQERPAGVSAAAQSTWMPEFSSASSAGAGASDTGPQDACSAAMANLEAASALLQWALKEAETLGPEERAEALRLPLQVAQALASRVAARVIRWALANRTSAEEDSASGVGAETASPAATAAAAAAAAAAV